MSIFLILGLVVATLIVLLRLKRSLGFSVLCSGLLIWLLLKPLKSSKAPTNYFTPNILRKSWSRLVVSVVHLDALAFPVAAT